MLNIRIKISILLTVLLFQFGTNLKAQGNLPYVDDKFFHFGFSLGFNTMDFGLQQSDSVIGGQIYDANVSTLKPGFSVGIITDFRLNRYLNARFTPTLHFGEREINYFGRKDSVGSSFTIQSIPICLPVYLKYSAERYGNCRPYLIGGGGMYIDLGQNKDKPVYLRTVDFYTEFGVGCDIYFSFFKLAPELKYAIGYKDLFVPLALRDEGKVAPADKKYSQALSRLTSRMLTLTFNFE
jgi:hypothetical protein